MIEVSPQGYLQQIDPSVYERSCLVDYEFDRKLKICLYLNPIQPENSPVDMEHLDGLAVEHMLICHIQ